MSWLSQHSAFNPVLVLGFLMNLSVFPALWSAYFLSFRATRSGNVRSRWGAASTPGQPVNAKEVLRAAQVGKDESTVRRWCRSWEKEAGVDLDVRRVVPAGAGGAAVRP
jgi:hypothetical protein